MAKLQNVKILTLVGAALLFLLVLWLVPHTPAPVVLFLQESTGRAVVALAHLFGLSAHYNASTQLFGVAGFDMLLAPECVALHYFAILWLTILLMPGQTWRRKLAGGLCCTTALAFLNILRLILLGVIGHSFPDHFAMVHDFVWQIVFAVVTFALCFVWTKSTRSRLLAKGGLLIVSLFSAAGFALLLNLARTSCLTGLVWLTDKLLLLLYTDLPYASRWWAISQKSFVMVRLLDEKVHYLLPGGREFTVYYWQDILGLALFWGLCVGTLWQARFGKSRDWSFPRWFAGVCGGTFLLLLAQIGSMVVLGLLLVSDAEALGKNLLWLMRGVSVLLPVLFWWFVFRSGRAASSMPLELSPEADAS